MGKTALAVEYAYRYAPAYDLIWWVKSEEPATLAADYAELAGELDLPQKDNPDQGVVVAAVRAWLRQHPGWLLIFDNVEKPEDLKDYLPQGGPGHVLITSRNPVWGRVARPLEVQVLPRDQSVEFLLKRTGQEDENAAKGLAEAVGDLPLALEQAGAYMEETGTPLAEYFHLFQSRRRDLWGQQKPPDDYHATVDNTWSLALEKITAEAPAAGDLLNLCAFLAPDDIPLSLLDEVEDDLPESLRELAADPLARNRALAALKRYSLIERGEDSLSVHRLVQAVVRDRLNIENQKTWLGVAVSLVSTFFPEECDDPVMWTLCSRLLPHAFVSIRKILVIKAGLENAAHLLNEVGRYLMARAELLKAKCCFEWAITIGKEVYKPNHHEFAAFYNNLGLVFGKVGDFLEAKHYFEQALLISKEAYGENDSRVATDLHNLGLILIELREFEDAKAKIKAALKIELDAYGKKGPSVALIFNSMGLLYRRAGDFIAAKKYYEKALNIYKVLDRPNLNRMAVTFFNLGVVLKELNELVHAKENIELSLSIWRQCVGMDHPHTQMAQENLKVVETLLWEQGG